MFIALKPLDRAEGHRRRGDRPAAPEAGPGAGRPDLFLQPVQDLRIGGRVSSAQYQYTLQGDNLEELNDLGAARRRRDCARCPSWRDVNSDQQNKGLQARLAIDRDTASRLGITPQMIDDTLYDAFGQRQVSIIYTLLNQYHVVMEVAPRFWQHPDTLQDIYVRSAGRRDGAAARVHPLRAVHHVAGGQPPGPVPGGDHLLQPGAGRVAREMPSTAIEAASEADGAAGQHPGQLPGHGRRPSRPRWPTSRC